MTTPDPAQRPKLVVWAYRCWLTAGVLLILVGLWYIILGLVAPRSLDPMAVGVLVAVVGVAYILIGSRAFVGDARWRSSLAALTLVVVALLLVLSFVAPILAFALIAGVIGIFGSLLAYRPESEFWYTGEMPPERKPLFGGRGPGRKDPGGKGTGGKK
ncbi:hypothetical protein QSJ18_05070 [Gordonia sp. ABSL1-1]|uniref:hypothetical protein n=1 Tax=Gordonia sp. ABSL1-1 TaxID=3053923 RepID=UPI002572F3DD|nr:hypothetical protein [Gordonia sp. ABSL1-1]MDL9936104.1 hypothetical protein [Gordonia sp. ABSL1-1]